MDLSLPAPKFFIAELQGAARDDNVMSLGSLRFQRVWLQGVIVSPLQHGILILDDGSAVIELALQKELQEETSWAPGMYVLVNGRYCQDLEPFVEVHKILDLSAESNRETAWHVEVAEAHDKFYGSLTRLDGSDGMQET